VDNRKIPANPLLKREKKVEGGRKNHKKNIRKFHIISGSLRAPHKKAGKERERKGEEEQTVQQHGKKEACTHTQQAVREKQAEPSNSRIAFVKKKLEFTAAREWSTHTETRFFPFPHECDDEESFFRIESKNSAVAIHRCLVL
jgi:hypothetical protein